MDALGGQDDARDPSGLQREGGLAPLIDEDFMRMRGALNRYKAAFGLAILEFGVLFTLMFGPCAVGLQTGQLDGL